MAIAGQKISTSSSESSKPKFIHFVGICGVGTSAAAIALHNARLSDGQAGWQVSGSDKGFYPPVSTALEAAGVKFYAGWHPELMGKPDMVVAGGGGTASSNPELVEAKRLGVPILSLAEFLGKYFVRENSIVVAGTWGKTSVTAILGYILREAGWQPSYMIGGIPVGFPSAALDKGRWSVLEGDEYQAAIWDRQAKFNYYSPTHLLLTAVSWDHADLYSTEDAYFAAFEKLVEGLPENGLLVACIDNPGVRKVIGRAKCKVVTYGKRSSANYQYARVGESREGLRFGIHHNKESYALESALIGGFQAENITGAFVMAKEIGVELKTISAAIASFGGIKRRFEKRYQSATLAVFDCHAPTPEKAKAVLRDLRNIYTSENIIAIYEPNIGGRTQESATKYTDAFSAADTCLIPRLTQLKVDSANARRPLEGKDLANLMARSHSDVRYIPNDDKLVEQVMRLALGPADGGTRNPTVVVFLGSHGFRGMIEQVINKLSEGLE